MIKAQVAINGEICKQANLRTDKEGNSYVCFSVKLTVPGSRNNMSGKNVFISTIANGTENDLSQYVLGSRIEAIGTLTFRKVADNIYLNFHADSINFNPDSRKDCLEGTVEFKGTVGKGVDEKVDKKGNPYILFHAYSTEKSGEQLQFIWIHFIRFNCSKEDYLQPKAKIHVKGKLSVTAYNDRMDFGSRVEELKPWDLPQKAQETDKLKD